MRFLDFQLDDAIARIPTGTTIKYVDITGSTFGNGLDKSTYPNAISYVDLSGNSGVCSLYTRYDKWYPYYYSSGSIYRVYYF